jgi:hypothetical protein
VVVTKIRALDSGKAALLAAIAYVLAAGSAVGQSRFQVGFFRLRLRLGFGLELNRFCDKHGVFGDPPQFLIAEVFGVIFLEAEAKMPAASPKATLLG